MLFRDEFWHAHDHSLTRREVWGYRICLVVGAVSLAAAVVWIFVMVVLAV